MNYFGWFVLFFAATCYVSSCFFVLTDSDEQVEVYCADAVLEDLHDLSQRKVACSLRKYR